MYNMEYLRNLVFLAALAEVGNSGFDQTTTSKQKGNQGGGSMVVSLPLGKHGAISLHRISSVPN